MEGFLIAQCTPNSIRTSCETTINLFDQSSPSIVLGSSIETLVACDPASVEASLPEVNVIDNCDSDITPTFTISVDESDPCFANNGRPDTTTATVVWTAVDDCGNIGTASRVFTIIRPFEFNRVDDEVRGCNDENISSTLPSLQVGHIDGNGDFVHTGDVALSEEEYICGYILQSDDVEIPSTDCGRKIFRFWSVVNWCDASSGPSALDTAFIEFTDTDAPVFQGEESDQVIAATDIELGPFDCTYDITNHPLPSATDDCDDNVDVTLHRVFRIEDGVNWPIDPADWTALDCDSFRLMFIADDQCHEQLENDTTRQIVVIQDVTEPSAICTDHLNISVPSDAGARIHYTDVDAGSFDACGISAIEIRRRDSGDSWGEFVDIGCEDVHSDLRIEMRVTDNKGNMNICWMSVTAEDKIAPICGDLPPVSLNCDELHTGELGAPTGGGLVELTGDLLATYNARFGDPLATCSDNLSCAGLAITQKYSLTELNCGALEIERQWSVVDWQPEGGNESNLGSQTITVSYVPNWTLTFPADVDLSCGDDFPAAATEADIIDNGACDLWALEVTEKTFEVPGDICVKVERTYELINWCVYEAGTCLLYTSPSPRDRTRSRMPSSA